MPWSFLLTGTGTGVGKTMVGCALAFAFKVRGLRVGVMKPVETGCLEDDGTLVPRDGPALIASASSNTPIELVSPCCYRAALEPAAAAWAEGADPPKLAKMIEAYQKIAARSDVVIVEDAGGLASPLDWRYDYGDLAAALGLAIILVVANRAAFLDAARLTVEHGRQRNVPVCGFVLNALDHEASATVERDAEFVARATGVSCLGTVRFKEPLSLAIVERLLKAGHDLNPDAER